MDLNEQRLFDIEDFVPELWKRFEEQPLDLDKVVLVAFPIVDYDKDHPERPLMPAEIDRRTMALTDGTNVCLWEVDSLRALFRGDKQPPVLGDFPDAYQEIFILLDLHVLEISKLFGDRRDAEMREIFSALRRRPDGRSSSFVHDYMWQAAAMILATRPLSQAEFEAIMARLERSARTFETDPTSRNFVTLGLRGTYDKKR